MGGELRELRCSISAIESMNFVFEVDISTFPALLTPPPLHRLCTILCLYNSVTSWLSPGPWHEE